MGCELRRYKASLQPCRGQREGEPWLPIRLNSSYVCRLTYLERFRKLRFLLLSRGWHGVCIGLSRQRLFTHSAFAGTVLLLLLPLLLALSLSQRDKNGHYVWLFGLLLRLKRAKLLVDESRNRGIWCFIPTARNITQEFAADVLGAEPVKRVEINMGKGCIGGCRRKDAICSEFNYALVEVEG